jgi:2,3-bisphosphoglycerate-independent phosphoglycerate mutase
MILRLLFLLLLLSSIAGGVDVHVGPEDKPASAVILVVDGLGASYVYPEHHAYALDGAPLGAAVLFNLTGSGGRVVDARVPVPETTKSHSVLVTGYSGVDPQFLGLTIFDSARKKGYLCLAVLERGDAMPMLQKMDAVLYLGDNAMHGAEPTPGFRESAPICLRPLFQEWRDRFAEYSAPQGVAGYAGYDAWGLDAAADIVRHQTGRPFLMLVNVGAVDSAGQNLGADGYLQTAAALDAPLGRLADACRQNNVLLVVTADHGMSFPSSKGKGGHSADKYMGRLESLRVPLVFLGPGVEEMNLGGRWSEVDIAPTVLNMLNVTENQSWEGRSIPLKQNYNLRVVGAPGGAALYRGDLLIANATGDGQCNFLGLARGLYSLRAGERSWQVLMDGDRTLDLTEKAVPPLGGMKKMVGVILILIINLIGAAVIVWIWRKE